MSTSVDGPSTRWWRESFDLNDRAVPLARLRGLTVRELLTALAASEDGLRHLESLVTQDGQTIPNPARLRLLARQRALVRELRARRGVLRSGPTTRPLPPSSWHSPPIT